MGLTTDPVQDAEPSAWASIAIPPGFHAYHLPSLETERSLVYRNWCRDGGRRSRPHAVILDEDPTVLDILGQLLDDEDYDVTLSSRFLTREEIARLRPDVIIADVAFNHGPDGQSLYDDPPVRADGSAIPVVYSTIIPGVAAQLEALETPILLKPFDLDALLAWLSPGDNI